LFNRIDFRMKFKTQFVKEKKRRSSITKEKKRSSSISKRSNWSFDEKVTLIKIALKYRTINNIEKLAKSIFCDLEFKNKFL